MEKLTLRQKLNRRTKEEKLLNDFDKFYTHCLRYGKIISDQKWKDSKCFYREYTIYINKMLAHIEMYNGNIISCGLSINNI